MKVRVEYSDGHYWMVPHTQAHTKHGMTAVNITDEEWREYQAFLKIEHNWQCFLSNLDRDQYEQDHPDDGGDNDPGQ